MTDKSAKTKTGRKRIKFSLYAPKANKVLLMGDFNQWNPRKHPMKQSSDGKWERTLLLEKGTYEYKFMVDASWQDDPLNSRICPNPFGSHNNLLEVKG